MKAFSKLILAAGVVCGLALGVYFGFAADMVDEVVADQLRASELDSQRARAYGVVEARNHIVERLISGQIDLLVAANQFHELSLQLPNFDWDHFQEQFSGVTEEECFCRHVISYVRNNGRFGDLRCAAAVDRLNVELQNYLTSR